MEVSMSANYVILDNQVFSAQKLIKVNSAKVVATGDTKKKL